MFCLLVNNKAQKQLNVIGHKPVKTFTRDAPLLAPPVSASNIDATVISTNIPPPTPEAGWESDLQLRADSMLFS